MFQERKTVQYEGQSDMEGCEVLACESYLLNSGIGRGELSWVAEGLVCIVSGSEVYLCYSYPSQLTCQS